MPSEVQSSPTAQASSPQQYDSGQNIKPPSILKKIMLVLFFVILLAVVAGLVIYFLRISKITARDNQRKTDVQKIASALEDFRQKTQNQLYYPGAITKVTMIDTGILTTIPSDPVGTEPYTYHFFRSPDGCVANCTGFSLTACLENTRDSKKDSMTKPVCPVASYTVSNR